MDFTLHLWSELHAAHIRVRKEVSSPARKSPLKPKPSSSTGLTKEKKKTPTRVASEEKEGSSLMAKFDSVEDEVFHVGLRDTFGVALVSLQMCRADGVKDFFEGGCPNLSQVADERVIFLIYFRP
jgi:hypothetical protein